MTHPIVACARGWIGTRFHHQGRIKKTGSHKGGVDCLGLLAGVAAELDLRDRNGKPLAAFDEKNYPHMPDTSYLREKLAASLLEVPLSLLPSGEGGAKRRMRDYRHTDKHNILHCPHPSPLPKGEGIWNITPGDIVLLRIDGSPQHLAIVSDFPPVLPLPRSGGGLGRGTIQNSEQAVAPSLTLPRCAGEGIGLGLIHAYAPARAVVEHALDTWWWERIEGAFRTQ